MALVAAAIVLGGPRPAVPEEGSGPSNDDPLELPVFEEDSEWFWSGPVVGVDVGPVDDGKELRFFVDSDGSNVSLPIFPPGPADMEIQVRAIRGAEPRILALRDEFGRPKALPIARVSRRVTRSVRFSMTEFEAYQLIVATEDREEGLFQVRVRAFPDRKSAEPLKGVDAFIPNRVVFATPPGEDVSGEFGDLEFSVIDPRYGICVADVEALPFPAPPEDPQYQPFPISGPPGALDWATLFAFLYRGVAVCEPDVRVGIPVDPVADGSQTNRIIVGSSFGRRDFEKQSSLRTVRARAAHGRATGAGVTVAVLDTGVDPTHPVLAGRVLPGRDLVDDDDDPREEKDGVDGNGDGRTSESFGHGTFVAGVILAAAPDARILPVRVLDDDGRGASSDVARGIYWAIENGADVINLSLGSPAYSATLAQAVRFAKRNNVLIVAAAGNDGERWVVDFPGTEPGVVSASALDRQGRRARYANGRRNTTVFAPGSGIIGPYPGNRWGEGKGTSFAAAFVTGAAALMRESHPTWSSAAMERRLTRRWKLDLKRLAR